MIRFSVVCEQISAFGRNVSPKQSSCPCWGSMKLVCVTGFGPAQVPQQLRRVWADPVHRYRIPLPLFGQFLATAFLRLQCAAASPVPLKTSAGGYGIIIYNAGVSLSNGQVVGMQVYIRCRAHDCCTSRRICLDGYHRSFGNSACLKLRELNAVRF